MAGGGKGGAGRPPADFDDDDVVSSGDEMGEDEISDDSQDLMAAAGNGTDFSDDDEEDDGEDASDGLGEFDEGIEEEDEDDEDEEEQEAGDGADCQGQDQAVAGGTDHCAAPPPNVKPHKLTLNEHDMLLTAQATSDTTVMQLQVAELLRETRATFSAKHTDLMASDLNRLRRVLAAISPHQVQGDQAAGFLRDLGLSPAAVSLQFQPPTAVVAVGSFPLGACMIRSTETGGTTVPTLDVAITMPPSCFYKKAHLNYRYHALRALYLATVTNHLAASPAFSTRPMHLETLQSDPTRPVLVLSGQTLDTQSEGIQGSPSYQIRIIPSLSPSLFPLPRLSPDRNGVRWVQRKQPPSTAPTTTGTPAAQPQAASAVAAGHASGANIKTGTATSKAASVAATDSAAVSGQAKQPKGVNPQEVSAALFAPTPTYNMGMLADMLIVPHAAVLQRTAAVFSSFADGLLLLKVWAHQHQLACSSGSADGLDGHTLAMVLTHLAERGKMTPAMSPLQVFRAGLQALSGSDASLSISKGITLARLTPDVLHATLQTAVPHLLNPPILVSKGKPAPKQPRQQQQHQDESAVMNAALGTTPDRSNVTLETDTPLVLEPSDSSKSPWFRSPPPNPNLYRKAHPVVVLDPTGWCNVACGVSRAAMSAVSSAARTSLSALSSPADGEAAFASVLLNPTRAAAAYDYVWVVDVPADVGYMELNKGDVPAAGTAGKGAGAGAEDELQGQEHWQYSRAGDVCVWRDQEAAVESVVRTALTDRAHLVRACRRPVPHAHVSALTQGLMPVSNAHQVWIGARLDPTLALRLVDTGPAADDIKAAAKFRAFWGPVAELRRFQDGKISEVVVWGAPGEGPGRRHGAPDKAVSYAVERHKPGGAPGTMRSSGMVLDGALRGEDDDPSAADVAVTSGRMLEAATDKLSKQLRGLEGLALKVMSVQPLSAASRHTALAPPAPHPLAGGVPAGSLGAALAPGTSLPRVMDVQELLVQLENSGRWPSHPDAFIKMKAALGLQLAQTVEKALGLHTQATEEFVDVLSDGFAFRLILYSGRDEAMLLRQAQGQSQTPGIPSSPSPSPESLPLIRSWHHGLVSRVGGANAAFAPACRLAKRWVAAHMMSNHFADEAVELLVAAVFTSKGPAGVTGSRVSGFLRFLQLLSRHPWASRPLLVDPDQSLTPGDVRRINQQFGDRRAIPNGGGTLPALYIVTPKDHMSRHWTQDRPSPAALSHLASLSTSCLMAASHLLESGVPAPPTLDTSSDPAPSRPQSDLDAAILGALFTPQLEQFDMLLTIRREALPRAQHALPAWLGASVSKRLRQPDLLTAMEEEAAEAAPPKRARVFLDAFPDKAVATRGPAALRDELLLGFDPVARLLTELEQQITGGSSKHTPATTSAPQHTGPAAVNGTTATTPATTATHMPQIATLCADGAGGKVLGLKWMPGSFLPASAKMASCHASLPCQTTKFKSPPLSGAEGPPCVPDVVRILTEICDLGEGIVTAVQVTRGCSKLPVGPPPSL